MTPLYCNIFRSQWYYYAFKSWQIFFYLGSRAIVIVHVTIKTVTHSFLFQAIHLSISSYDKKDAGSRRVKTAPDTLYATYQRVVYNTLKTWRWKQEHY